MRENICAAFFRGQNNDSIPRNENGLFEFLPILMYDTDIGFGYGLKAFLRNHLSSDESLDLLVFNSTKGERWYRLVFSIPDFELRQGTLYPLAFDVVVDYDKMIQNNFFGIGNRSSYDDKETYTKEPFEISMTVSRGFSRYFVTQAGIRFRTVQNYRFSENSSLFSLLPSKNHGRVTTGSMFTACRYDTRDSYINPSQGSVIMVEGEWIPNVSFNNAAFHRLGVSLQYYYSPINMLVLASRLFGQSVFGDELPVQVLLPIGGGSTLRGYSLDRYIDKVSMILNSEIRFPIIWRFSGIVGIDAGKVWESVSKIDLSRWVWNPVIGLRFHMEGFIVRFDVGLGRETTGIYFNFGHMF